MGLFETFLIKWLFLGIWGITWYNLDMPTLNGSRSYGKKNGKIGLLPRFALPVLSYFSLQQIVIHHHSPRAANWHSFQCVSSCSNFQFGLRASIPAAQLSQSAIRVEPAFETSASRNLSMTSTRTKTVFLLVVLPKIIQNWPSFMMSMGKTMIWR